MPNAQPRYPFQVSPEDLQSDIDHFVDVTFESLSTFYLELPRGGHFIEYDRFHAAYEKLKAATNEFKHLDRASVSRAATEDSLVLVVLRCIVGLSPPELADYATEITGVAVTQGFARAQDQRARDGADLYRNARTETARRLGALLEAAATAIEHGPEPAPGTIHRLDKIDTTGGLDTVRRIAAERVPYSALLYERLLGRPFASHRDAVSEEVGDIIEDAIVAELRRAEVPYHRTGRAERVEGFDQAPDFLIPDTTTPCAVIEAKLTQDDGTARDKVTRVQHLDRLSDGGTKFEVIACIDGRGFKIRREDMKKLLLATRGKVFSKGTIGQLVKETSLSRFSRR